MVNYGDKVVIYGHASDGTLEEDEALVLGCEEDFVWLYSTTTRTIYRSNPACILEHKERQVLFQYDYCESRDDVFDEHGQCDPGVFWHASQPVRARMTKLLQAWMLIDP